MGAQPCCPLNANAVPCAEETGRVVLKYFHVQLGPQRTAEDEEMQKSIFQVQMLFPARQELNFFEKSTYSSLSKCLVLLVQNTRLISHHSLEGIENSTTKTTYTLGLAYRSL